MCLDHLVKSLIITFIGFLPLFRWYTIACVIIIIIISVIITIHRTTVHDFLDGLIKF